MTCKDCIHFEVCDSGRHIGEYIEDDGVYTDGVEKECPTFKLDASVIDLADVISRIEDCCIVVNRPGIEKIKADYGVNCGWISASDRLPDHEEFVLAIVSGKPKSNITLRGSYEIASYLKEDGWLVETFPEWKSPTVTYWRELPLGPERPR